MGTWSCACGHIRALKELIWTQRCGSPTQIHQSVMVEVKNFRKGPKNACAISLIWVRGHLTSHYQIHSEIMAHINPLCFLHG